MSRTATPDDNHGSFDKECQVRVAEMMVIRIKTDLGISYGEKNSRNKSTGKSDGEKRRSNAERTRKRASSNQGKPEKHEGDDRED
jgi:hypothetical protein